MEEVGWMDFQKSYLILINPKSGKKQGLEIYKKYLLPQLLKSNLNYEVVLTNRPNHALDIAKNILIGKYNRIILISGDGLIHETINGFMAHKNWESAIKIPLAVIPGGTGNALHRSICHEYSTYKPKTFISNCIKHALFGELKSLDILRVTLQDGTISYAILGVSWGLIADVDIESEIHRYMGSLRYLLHGFWRIQNLRYYTGTVKYCPATNPTMLVEYMKTTENIEMQTSNVESFSNGVTKKALDKMCNSIQHNNELYINENNLFVALYVSNLPYISQDFAVTPEAKLNDGHCHLCILKHGVKKSQMRDYLFNRITIDAIDSRYRFSQTVQSVMVEPKAYFNRKKCILLPYDSNIVTIHPITPRNSNNKDNESIMMNDFTKFFTSQQKTKVKTSSSTPNFCSLTPHLSSADPMIGLLKRNLTRIRQLLSQLFCCTNNSSKNSIEQPHNRSKLKWRLRSNFNITANGNNIAQLITHDDQNASSQAIDESDIVQPQINTCKLQNVLPPNNQSNIENQKYDLSSSSFELQERYDHTLINGFNRKNDAIIKGEQNKQPTSWITIDGEAHPCCSFKVEILPGLARILA